MHGDESTPMSGDFITLQSFRMEFLDHLSQILHCATSDSPNASMRIPALGISFFLSFSDCQTVKAVGGRAEA